LSRVFIDSLIHCASLAALGLLLVACSVPTEDTYYPPVPDRTFALIAVGLPQPSDQPQPVNPTITLSLSDLPDPATVQFPALRLGPRGQSIEYLVEISLVERTLTLRPKRQLLPENDYFVGLTQDLRALSGQRLAQPVSVRFHTGSFVGPEPVAPSPVQLSQLLSAAGGLQARCASVGCHSSKDGSGGNLGSAAQGLDLGAPPAALLDRLSRPALGSLEGLLLVQPGVPEQSYLLRKLVAGGGFARSSGEPMPPGGLWPLEPAMLRALELWIRQGAR
jgi:hypothetical protein